MAVELTERLAELAYLEREISRVMNEAAARIADPEVRQLTKGVAEDHSQQAFEVDDIASSLGGADVSQKTQRAAASLGKRLNDASDQGGIVDALLWAEREDLDLEQDILALSPPDNVAQVLEQHVASEEDHVNFFENRAPAMAPDIRGNQAVPGKGFGAF